MTSEKKRNALLKLFWGMINEKLRGDKDIAYDLLDAKYPKAKRSTRQLTIDELAAVVKELAKRTRTRIDLGWLYTDRQQGKARRPRRAAVSEPVTKPQILLILDLAAQIPINNHTLAAMVERAAQGKEVMTLTQAQALIEALKSMRDRRWQETHPDTDPTTATQDDFQESPLERGGPAQPGRGVSWHVPPNSRTTH